MTGNLGNIIGLTHKNDEPRNTFTYKHAMPKHSAPKCGENTYVTITCLFINRILQRLMMKYYLRTFTIVC